VHVPLVEGKRREHRGGDRRRDEDEVDQVAPALAAVARLLHRGHIRQRRGGAGVVELAVPRVPVLVRGRRAHGRLGGGVELVLGVQHAQAGVGPGGAGRAGDQHAGPEGDPPAAAGALLAVLAAAVVEGDERGIDRLGRARLDLDLGLPALEAVRLDGDGVAPGAQPAHPRRAGAQAGADLVVDQHGAALGVGRDGDDPLVRRAGQLAVQRAGVAAQPAGLADVAERDHAVGLALELGGLGVEQLEGHLVGAALALQLAVDAALGAELLADVRHAAAALVAAIRQHLDLEQILVAVGRQLERTARPVGLAAQLLGDRLGGADRLLVGGALADHLEAEHRDLRLGERGTRPGEERYQADRRWHEAWAQPAALYTRLAGSRPIRYPDPGMRFPGTLSARIIVGFAVLIVTFGGISLSAVLTTDQLNRSIRVIRIGYLQLALETRDLADRQDNLVGYLRDELAGDSSPRRAETRIKRLLASRERLLGQLEQTLARVDDIPAIHRDAMDDTRKELGDIRRMIGEAEPLYAELQAAPPLERLQGGPGRPGINPARAEAGALALRKVI